MSSVAFRCCRAIRPCITTLAIVVAAAIAPPAFAGFSVYTVGADSACGFTSIQDAVDAAAANAGEDYVFITNSASYAGEHVVVNDPAVDIVGGFPDCSQLGDPGVAQTTIVGTSGHSVFEIEGNSQVYMSNLVLTGAVMDGDHHGGGIYFGGQGGLTLRYSWIFQNQAGYGGGIAVNPSGPTTLNLIASTVSANTALATGGGIEIEGPTTFTATALGGDAVYIANNAALGGDGGGVKVLGPATATVSSSVIDLNTATGAGGGISAVATNAGPASITLYTINPAIPVTVYGNDGGPSGGGISLVSRGSSLAKLCAWDFAIDANVATFGSAIYAGTDDDHNGSIAFLNSDGCDRPADAVACAGGAACNEIDDNASTTSTDDGSGTIHIASASTLSASRFSMRRNQGVSLIHFDSDAEPSNGGGDYVHLHDCLFAGNTLTGNLFRAFGGAAQTELAVDACTITDNIMPDNAYVLGADTNFAYIINSIIYQPLQPSLIFFGPEADLTALYILTNDTIPFTGHTGIVDGAPTFVDAASGDYHQTRSSPGVDFAPASDGVDLDGNPRTFDLTDIPDQWGPMDVGAYELQTPPALALCAMADTVFCNGFEDVPAAIRE